MDHEEMPSPTQEQTIAVIRVLQATIRQYPGHEEEFSTLLLNIIRVLWGEDEVELAFPTITDLVTRELEQRGIKLGNLHGALIRKGEPTINEKGDIIDVKHYVAYSDVKNLFPKDDDLLPN